MTANTQNEILNFIDKLNIDPAVTANFHTRLSYWWANLVNARFYINSANNVAIMYNPSNHMFAARINYKLYDARGLVKNPDDFEIWDVYAHNNQETANEVMRTMIYFLSPKEWEQFIQSYEFVIS